MLNVDGNKDESVTLTAGGNDDDGSALGNDDDGSALGNDDDGSAVGNDDDAVRAIHSMPSHVVMMYILGWWWLSKTERLELWSDQMDNSWKSQNNKE